MLPTIEPGHVDLGTESLSELSFGERYQQRKLLGQGGMGEVRLCQDRRIGREVALKVIRGAQGARADLRARFVREARVQGQLEHPAVVPVYDLGIGPAGEVYFTMKRIRGVSLEEILAGLRAGDAALAARYTRHKLLSAFGQVCLAVDFAHLRGVIHRDLKPANIMLGDFGEVYVLDWGVARIAGAPELLEAGAAPPAGPQAGMTVEGQMMGTPGYMAPEQARGETGALSPRTDVYALGAILFEILTLEPLHTGTHVARLLTSTLRGVDARPSARRPEAACPPELEAICVRAAALDPAQRFAGARALSDAVERFLAGDRDLELRRQMAMQHARQAEEAAAGAGASEEERRRALREVGRALGLDPNNPTAMRTLLRLLTEPPRAVPAEARAEMDRSASEATRLGFKTGSVAYLAWILLLLFFLWMGIRDVRTAVALFSLVAVNGALTFLVGRRAGSPLVYPLMALTGLMLAVGTRIFGPFVLIPAVAPISALSYAMQPDRRLRFGMAATGCLAILVPVLLEALHRLPASYQFQDGAMKVLPQMCALPPGPTTFFLLLTSLATNLTLTLYVGQVRDAQTAAEERLQMYSWQLRQMIGR